MDTITLQAEDIHRLAQGRPIVAMSKVDFELLPPPAKLRLELRACLVLFDPMPGQQKRSGD